MAYPIEIAQAPPAKPPTINAPLPIPPSGASPAPRQPVAQPATSTSSDFKPRELQATDVLDKLGLGPVADVAIVSILAIICGVVLIALTDKVKAMAFGAVEDSLARADAVRKQYFELVSRKERALPKIERVNARIADMQKKGSA